MNDLPARLKALYDVIEEDKDWALAASLWLRLKEQLGDKSRATFVLAAGIIVAASECADPAELINAMIGQLANNPLCEVPS